MIARAMVTLRQHRFELAFSILAAVAASVLGLSIALQINGLGVTQECLDLARATQDGSNLDAECFSKIQAGSSILGDAYVGGQGTLQLSIMGVLPFIVGLLGGLPIVARELEERTAQTAWWLSASRTRWLTTQILPIGVLLSIALAIAAAIATPVAAEWARWGLGGAAELIGQHGPLALIRALAAFGIALAAGALFGRALPALILGAALVMAILFMVGQAREAWLSSLPLTVLATQSAETGEWVVVPAGEVRAFGFIASDGRFVTREVARQLATDAGVPPADPTDEQDLPALVWLEEQGYTEVPVGVTDEMALGWAPYDGVSFGIVGLLGVAGGYMVVNRRRPS